MNYTPLSTQPKNISCKHEEWGLINIGPDDYGKECFCKLDSHECPGVEYCKQHYPYKWDKEYVKNIIGE